MQMHQIGSSKEFYSSPQKWAGVVDIGFLTEAERDAIVDVLKRDEKLRIREKQRIIGLKRELQEVRRKGAKQTDQTYGSNACARCKSNTGIISNKPITCPVCRHKTCKKCRVHCNDSWKCVVCFQEGKVKASSGDWFYEQMRPDLKEALDGCTALKHAVIRTMSPVPRDALSVESLESVGSSTESRSHRKSTSSLTSRGFVETGTIDSLRESKTQMKTQSLERSSPVVVPKIQVEATESSDDRSVFSDQGSQSTDTSGTYERHGGGKTTNVRWKRKARSLGSLRSLSRSLTDLASPLSLSRLSKPDPRSRPMFMSTSRLSEDDPATIRPSDKLGEIKFSLTYNYKSSALVVFIAECRYLSADGAQSKKFAPYVKCYLLPDRSVKRKSSTKKSTSSPKFNQELKFQLTLAEMSNRVLEISVWNAATLSRNSFLGHVQVALDGWKFSDIPHWYPLKSKDPSVGDVTAYKGDVILSVCYVPPAEPALDFGELRVLMKEAKNLLPMLPDGTVDVYARLQVLPEKTTREKTSTLAGSNSPSWNASFELPLLNQSVDRAGLQITLWHRPPKSKSDKTQHVFVGGIQMSSTQGDVSHLCTKAEQKAWNRIIRSPSTWVDVSLPLRSF